MEGLVIFKREIKNIDEVEKYGFILSLSEIEVSKQRHPTNSLVRYYPGGKLNPDPDSWSELHGSPATFWFSVNQNLCRN